MKKEYIAFDFETTGLSPNKGARIIEIGAVKFNGRKVIGEFHSLINPGFEIPYFITCINGISNEMVEDAPLINDVIFDFHDFISTDTLIAHNANFDIKFLKAAFDEAGIKMFTNDVIDTLSMSRKAFPKFKCHKLDYLTEKLKITKSLHRALADAHSCKELFCKCLKKNKIKSI